MAVTPWEYTAAPGAVPPGWYPDPYAPGLLRWWDGFAWTSHTARQAPQPSPHQRSNGYGGRIAVAVAAVTAFAVALAGIGAVTGSVSNQPTDSADASDPYARPDSPLSSPTTGVAAALAATVAVEVDLGGDEYATGAAVAISPTEFLTAEHVVEGGRSIVVIDASGNVLPAEVTRRDAQKDLAVLITEPHGLPPLDIRYERLPRGEDVWAIGGSDWREPISAGDARGTVDVCDDGVLVVRATAPIHPGDSGGPMVDAAGRIVGVNSFSLDDGFNYAIATEEVAELLAANPRSLDRDGYLVRPEDRIDGTCEIE